MRVSFTIHSIPVVVSMTVDLAVVVDIGHSDLGRCGGGKVCGGDGAGPRVVDDKLGTIAKDLQQYEGVPAGSPECVGTTLVLANPSPNLTKPVLPTP